MTFGAGGFLCSLSDKELAEFHHFLEKDFHFENPAESSMQSSVLVDSLRGLGVE